MQLLDKLGVPQDDLAMMDDAQDKANNDMKQLLPLDPCEECADIDNPMNVEVEDIGTGIEDDLYDL